MLVFDEKKYARNLLKEKKFQTYRQKDIERYILIRYLANEGKNFDEIKKDFSHQKKITQKRKYSNASKNNSI